MKFFDTFSGIGGFAKPLTEAGHECVGFSEINKYAIKVYQKHFDHKNFGDITKIVAEKLPDFDLLVGGFPCQSFSMAGKRGGFNDTRGTLFFDLARILKAKKPKWFIFENVKGLTNHDKGRTLGVITRTLWELGYAMDYKVLNSKDFGVPQNRERIFLVGTLDWSGVKEFWHFDYPVPPKTPCKLSDILEDEVDEKYFLSDKAVKKCLDYTKRNKENGNGFEAKFHDTEEVMGTLKGGGGGGGTCDLIRVGQSSNDGSQAGAVYDSRGIFPAMCAGSHGYAMGLIELTTGCSQANRIYDPDGISSTLASEGGGQGAKTGLYLVRQTKDGFHQFRNDKKKSSIQGSHVTYPHGKSHCLNTVHVPMVLEKILVPEATKKGYAEAKEGDSINLSNMNSKTRRGRFGHAVAQTLDTGAQQYTVAGKRIRRLTPVEAARLQGFPDDWCGVLSDSQQYKCYGNAVTTNVVKAIIRQIQ